MDVSLCAEVLQLARAMELQAIGQYMQLHYYLADKNYPDLAMSVKRIAIDEMRHAEQLSERIRDLGFTPCTTPAGPVENVDSWDAALALETETLELYNSYIQQLREYGDNVSCDLLKVISNEEDSHHKYFKDIADSMARFGDFYLAAQSGTLYDADN